MVINLSVKYNVYEEKRGVLFFLFFIFTREGERERNGNWRDGVSVCMEMETEVVRFECRLRK